MRRVLQVLGHSAGGIARHVAQLVTLLDGVDGFRVDIAGPPDLPVPLPKDVHPVVIPDGPFLGHRGAIVGLRRVIVSERIDVVHAHGLRAAIDASLAARGSGVPVFATVHNLVRPEITGGRAPLYRWGENLVVHLARRTFAVSEDIASHLRERVPSSAQRVEVLHLGAGPLPQPSRTSAEVRAAAGVSSDQTLIVTASRLSPQKAVDVMLHALAQLAPDFVLAISGVGPLERELRTLAERLGLADRVRWLGFRNDLADLIAAADVFCLSSIWEGVPLAAMEAIQLGTPVIATAVGGMPELIEDGRSGRLVAPRNPRALALAIREVARDPDRRRWYVENARVDLEKNFSTERMLARLMEAYEDGSDA